MKPKLYKKIKPRLPKGFYAAGIKCGIKRSEKNDFALITSHVPAVTVATFTRNYLKAAPLLITEQRLRTNSARAFLINSGNANCCTGQVGIDDALAVSSAVSKASGIAEESILIASTGKIGIRMPVAKMCKAAPALVAALSTHGVKEAAKGILTTDTCVKIETVHVLCSGTPVTITGIAKGSGMIKPNMATMIAAIMTDAAISASVLKKETRRIVAATFNKISVDGQMSTNDIVVVMANGQAGGRRLKPGSSDYNKFIAGLNQVMRSLALIIARDGEGARKFFEVKVTGAATVKAAQQVADSIADSPLVKTAIGAGDHNWGRIAQAVGSSGAVITPEKFTIGYYAFDPEAEVPPVTVFAKGAAVAACRRQCAAILRKEYMGIAIDLGMGKQQAFRWSCDLSENYVKINSKY